MPQQGIFSIAPDAQTGGSTGAPVNGGGNGSPFTPISDGRPQAPAQASAQASPFTEVQGSPFEPAQGADSGGRNGGGIPERRPEGQPSALGGGVPETESAVHAQPAAETQAFQAANDNGSGGGSGGGAFQMNGFPEQVGEQVMEAAPVAPVQEASPFVAMQYERPDYESAKASLEPQQDFAAVHPRYTPVQSVQPPQAPVPQAPPQVEAPVQQFQPVHALQPEASPVQVTAVSPSNVIVNEAPAFQQLELRAIFGVGHVLDVNQILQRARTLPGIRNVAVVGQQEAHALSNFRLAMQGMGFGDSNEMKLSSGGGTVDFITEGETSVAVLLEGNYAPGVQETLIIVAREIGKLA
jgi:hypothetical protein